MKRWITSSLITFAILLLACIISSFFTIEETHSSQTDSTGQSVVTVIKKIKPKKKIVEKIKKLENVIAAPDATIQEEKPEEQEPEENQEEFEESQSETQNDVEDSSLSEERQKNEETYKGYALKRIASKKMYPMKSRAKGHEGNVRIHIVIDTNGNLTEISILEPCEFEELNEAALNAVKKSAPFKKMQPGSRPLEFRVLMEFKLN
ncbi:energy transducer TonB [Treponema pectinovorum]|uniref:energy transducer TonB n=1 Tax=Treponema pectinovorum TaxID=164 RepID=UPI0011CB3E6D|nr:energy transducer TonB [Treponema pectinovorum]